MKKKYKKMADFPTRGHKTLVFRQHDSSLNKNWRKTEQKRYKDGTRNNMGKQKKVSRPRTTSPQVRESMVKELKQSHETKTQIIKQPIWQTHGIYQKTIDEMSLERPIREHSIPHNPNFGKRQFDRLVDIWN